MKLLLNLEFYKFKVPKQIVIGGSPHSLCARKLSSIRRVQLLVRELTLADQKKI